MSKTYALHALRIGLGITFLWIGILISQNPEAWGGFIQPWALKLLPVSLVKAMMATAVLDMAVGVFLLVNVFSWLVAFVGAVHLTIVLITSGINPVTVRDIGLLGAALGLALYSWPEKYYFWRK